MSQQQECIFLIEYDDGITAEKILPTSPDQIEKTKTRLEDLIDLATYFNRHVKTVTITGFPDPGWVEKATAQLNKKLANKK